MSEVFPETPLGSPAAAPGECGCPNFGLLADMAERSGAAEARAVLADAEVRKLRAQLAEVRRIAYQGGQDAASVRQELLAYLEASGGQHA